MSETITYQFTCYMWRGRWLRELISAEICLYDKIVRHWVKMLVVSIYILNDCKHLYTMADRSEMARNAIESDFRTYKMAAEKNFCIDLKWQMARI